MRNTILDAGYHFLMTFLRAYPKQKSPATNRADGCALTWTARHGFKYVPPKRFL